ncbi:AAA family ATPase [Labilibaculum sp.]|uniref:AAA family ATPase n=1 Tax=Labilibaculum sp. TaxID=2060723 RepID=UPI003563FB97
MIYSYLDTLLEKWIDWTEGFLSEKLQANTNDLNAILGTNGSDNPTRSKELYDIGVLNYPLTRSPIAYDNLRKDLPIHSDFGYLSYLIKRAIDKDEGNQILQKGYNAICCFCLIQQNATLNDRPISLNFILQRLLELFPMPLDADERSYLRYLTAAMFCELNINQNVFLTRILNDAPFPIKIIESDKISIRVEFSNAKDIIKAIDEKISLTGIVYEKGSVFFIGNHKNKNPRGLFYISYMNFQSFLYDFYTLEKSNVDKDVFNEIFTKKSPVNIINEFSQIFKTNKNYSALMISLKEGCLEAFKVLAWDDKKSSIKSEISLNRIYFGAPGTGKSYTVDFLTKDLDDKFKRKITFHPDYDHSSFVGCYKPQSIGNDIKYQFSPQVFTDIYVDAWNDESSNIYYLIIDEINRGNCAEIFGDLFQLLDRNDEGLSKYEITPNEDLKKYLVEEFKGESRGIENGKMRLPSNLVILATMNTSDQSLYPMDSAFKRRWDWIYVPIEYRDTCSDGTKNESYSFKVEIEEGRTFDWIQFIEKVNNKIKDNPSLGADKQIGNYFVKPKTKSDGTMGNIKLKDFIHKVMFYLWNDVFKDEEDSIFENKTTYQDLFPIEISGLKMIEGILDKLGVAYAKEAEDVATTDAD